jgi:glycosyltransferase involved in cell wall biosynthesis
MTSNSKVEILMAVFNGAAYLPEQINSLLNQTYTNWNLIIRDNHSTDNTVSLVKEYINAFPKKIALIESGKNIGACQNFAKLLENSTASYIMFCDADDVWLSDKIEATLNKTKEMEKEYGEKTPILVHTDLKVVDKNLKILSDSFWKYQKLDPKKGRTLNRLIVGNTITGCTLMINRNLRDLSVPIPTQAIMHDWWIALVAAAFGKISYINQPTILYRQHGKNDTGAKHWSMKYIFKKFLTFLKTSELQKSLERTRSQCQIFIERYISSLDKNKLEMLRVYAELDRFNFFQKRAHLMRYRLFKTGFIRNLALIARI